MKMKYSVVLTTLATTGGNVWDKPQEVLETVARAGFDGVDIDLVDLFKRYVAIFARLEQDCGRDQEPGSGCRPPRPVTDTGRRPLAQLD